MGKFKYCSKCGAKLQDNNNFCNKCGMKLNKKSSFISWKIFLLALLVAGVVIFEIMRKEIINCITPTTSLDLNSFTNIILFDNNSPGLWGIVMIGSFATIIINEWILYKKSVNKYWTIFNRSLNLIGWIIFLFGMSIGSASGDNGENIGNFVFVIFSMLLLLVIFSLGTYHIYEKKLQGELGDKFWKRFRGVVIAIFTVFTIFDSFVIFETYINGKISYIEMVNKNREKKGTNAVTQIRKIFSNCELKLNGEDAINYQDCTMHVVRENNDMPLAFCNNNDEYNFQIYMDKYDRFQYYPDTIAEDNAQGVIGNNEYSCMYLSIHMTDSGKLMIKIDPADGKSHNYELKDNDGIPSLNGTLEVCGCSPEPASFTLAN